MIKQWTRGDHTVFLNGVLISLPAPLAWFNELPDGRAIVVTLFDENTPLEQTNAFVFASDGSLETEIKIEEDGRLVRFLASEVSEGETVLAVANNFRYKLNPENWSVLDRLYYR